MSPCFLNFAYGSNMSSARLRVRTPSARPLGKAWLAGHALRWHKPARDGSGKCAFVPTGDPRDRLWGVLYEIDEAERPWLDAAEALGTGYEHVTVQVFTETDMVTAIAYRAMPPQLDLQPLDWYHAYVMAGALEHGLPEDYVRALAAVAVIPHTDLRWAAEIENASRAPRRTTSAD